MTIQALTQDLIEGLVVFATDLLMPCMIVGFLLAVMLRILIYYNMSREVWFTREFAKRVDRLLEQIEQNTERSFYITAKRLLERTFYEIFINRSIMMRRKPDYITSLADRVFLIQHGTARLIKETLKQIRNVRHSQYQQPNFTEIAIHVFESNPCYNKIFGVLPGTVINDFINSLPGIFIISGIFGTFLGIMKALPELGGLDFTDIEGSKAILDAFLLKVSFAMSTSIVGIILSVITTFMNSLISPRNSFVKAVNSYNNSLTILWSISSHNSVLNPVEDFDENKDPMEALAEQAILLELENKPIPHKPMSAG